jgi:hypothetical protein
LGNFHVVNPFLFSEHPKVRCAYRAELSAGLASKEALLEALSAALRFPDYFGGNWDALEECIRDLSWLPDGDVLLLHKDLPLSKDPKLLAAYLSILKDAVENWRASGERRLYVAFPPHVELEARRLMRPK